MKKANIYKVSVKDKSVKEGKTQITCVATSLSEAVMTTAPAVWNSDTLPCTIWNSRYWLLSLRHLSEA